MLIVDHRSLKKIKVILYYIFKYFFFLLKYKNVPFVFIILSYIYNSVKLKQSGPRDTNSSVHVFIVCICTMKCENDKYNILLRMLYNMLLYEVFRNVRLTCIECTVRRCV